MCIKDYETEIGGQGPVRAVELLERKNVNCGYLNIYFSVYQPRSYCIFNFLFSRNCENWPSSYFELQSLCPGLLFALTQEFLAAEGPACVQFTVSYISRLQMYRLIKPSRFRYYETSLRSCKKEVGTVNQVGPSPLNFPVAYIQILYSMEK
jgi:hypothetical protein